MAAVLEFECPACGGGLKFEPSSQNIKCPFCDTELSVEAIEALSKEQSKDSVEEMEWSAPAGEQFSEADHLQSYLCNSCGGQLICDENTAATSCPYCGNPVVLAGRVAGSLRPDLVIPFKLDKEAAKAALQKHTSGKILLPKLFKSENRIDKIQGIYVPFWLFDTQADADIQYRATTVHTWSDSNYIYTRTRYYKVRRAGTLDFEGVPVDGSAKMDNDLMESIEPYDLSQAVDFQKAYLAGYLADKYDVSSEESAIRANERIRVSTEEAFRRTASQYTTLTPERTDLKLSNGRIRYALLPVWMLTTHYKGKNYTFAMNGQTGKMVGDLPMNVGAFWGWFAGIAAAGTLLAYLIGLLIGG